MPRLPECAAQTALSFGQALSRVHAPAWLLRLWVTYAASLSCRLMRSAPRIVMRVWMLMVWSL